jgi:probable rRNA maturation factor
VATLSIAHTTRSYPKGPYRQIKDDILGRTYTLSLVFVGEQRARTLNRTHRKKTYTPNVLSFSLSPHEGEVFICPAVARREAPAFGMSYRAYVAFLLIHGLLHLKGYRHSATMERAEARYRTKYRL